MSKISEEGYLFIHSGNFNIKQIEFNLKACVNILKKKNKNIKDCDIYVNVVENKDGMKFGHTYAWVSDPQVYNALIGNNFDGSKRIEEKENEDWTPPNISLEEALKEAKGDWGAEAEIEERYERPMLEIDLDPLIVPPGIKYTEEQRQQLEIDDDYGFIEIYPARITIRSEENKTNAIYSSCIPEWVNEEMLVKFFKKFSKDKKIHINPKDKKSFSYPKIVISKNTSKNKWRKDENTFNAHIFFSPLDRNLCYFIMNIARKIKIKNPNTNAYEMLFFSQSRSRP